MLSQLVDSYLELRRSTGFGMAVHEYLLHSFASFAAQRGESHIRSRTAIEWAAQAPSEGQRANRLGMLRVFARFARAEDADHRRSRRKAVIYGARGVMSVLLRSKLQPFQFAAARLAITPSQLQLEQINAAMVLAFLQHIEGEGTNRCCRFGCVPCTSLRPLCLHPRLFGRRNKTR
jgi:hypothetical protein